MTTIEIKQNFHNLIDEIDNKQLLVFFYDLMKKRNSSQDGDLWKSLSEEEQIGLLEALEEIKNPQNLIPHVEMKNKHSKWL